MRWPYDPIPGPYSLPYLDEILFHMSGMWQCPMRGAGIPGKDPRKIQAAPERFNSQIQHQHEGIRWFPNILLTKVC